MMPRPTEKPCIDCDHYHGKFYRSDSGERRPPLVCAMHPFGPEDEACPDFKVAPELTEGQIAALEGSLAARSEAAAEALQDLGIALVSVGKSYAKAAQAMAQAAQAALTQQRR